MAGLLVLATTGWAAIPEVFIAPNGVDTNAGTRSQPFASFQRAREEVRVLVGDGSHSRKPVIVSVRGGDYEFTDSFELTALDSGASNAPITWRAYPGETVRLLGGKPVPRSAFVPVSDPAILERLAEPARKSVRQADLRVMGFTRFGELKSRGFARPTIPAHSELFVDSKPMTLARWPNEGEFEQIAGFPDGEAQDDGHRGQTGKLEAGFYYSGDRPRGWRHTRDVWVHGYWSWDWANSYEQITAIDLDKRQVRTAAPHGNYGFRKGQRFLFLNVLEELDQPGEYYLDVSAGTLYFWPLSNSTSGSDSSNSAALLSLLAAPILKLENASHVVIRGFILEATCGTAIEIQGGVSNFVQDCTLRNLGNYGVTIRGGFGHGVDGCNIFDTGDGGVSLEGGDRNTLKPGGHFVQDCHFARQGRWTKCYVPAVLMTGVGLRASHNLIHDHPHCAILFNGNDHLVDFNHIHHIALETGDVGAIYTGRDYSWRGNRIRHNFIHHTGGVGMGSMGVYMDDCVSGTEIYGNLFYKVQRAVFLGGGRDHLVGNNLFVECDHAVEIDGRGLDTAPVWRSMVESFMRERLAAVPGELYRQRYPAMKTLDEYYGPPGGPVVSREDFKGIPPLGNVVATNVCMGKWLRIYWHAEPSMVTLHNNLTNAEPRFLRAPGPRPEAADFTLPADSPAWSLGFQPIPSNQIGPRRRQP